MRLANSRESRVLASLFSVCGFFSSIIVFLIDVSTVFSSSSTVLMMTFKVSASFFSDAGYQPSVPDVVHDLNFTAHNGTFRPWVSTFMA